MPPDSSEDTHHWRHSMYSRSARRGARAATVLGAGLCAFLAGCSDQQRLPTSVAAKAASGDRAPNKVQCAADNAHLTLPPGFCVVVVADLTENGAPAAARHLAITPD